MEHWIDRLRTRLIHMLGGYTVDEATPNRKIQHIKATHCYTFDASQTNISERHLMERDKATRKLGALLALSATVKEHVEFDTGKIVLRLSMSIVDQDIF